MNKSTLSKLYPIVLILAMYVVYQYRDNTNKKEVQNRKELHKHRKVISGKTMGTTYTVVYYDSTNQVIQPKIDSLLDNFNQYLSTYVPTSEISRFNKYHQLDSLSDYFSVVLKKSKEINEVSNGAFDPTVMPLVNLWGFGYKKNTKVPDTAQIDSVKQYVGLDKIEFVDGTLSSAKNIELGFGAIAKGYGVDLVGELLNELNIDTYLVEIGGENLAKGLKPGKEKWGLGIVYPDKLMALASEKYCGVLLADKAMATSGPYIQQKEINGIKYSHTIDPRTGFPVKQTLLSISVIADDCMTADALATAINVMTLNEAKTFFKNNTQYEGLLLYLENDKIKEFATEGFESLIVR